MEFISNLLYLLILIAIGFVGGELIAKIKLPKVLGYLLVGMILGPFALGFVNETALDSTLMKMFLLVAVGFVGYMVGAGIHVDELKKSGKSTLIIGLLEAYVPFLLVTIAVYLVLGWDLITALVVGSIALATAPAMALSISQEYKTKGPVTKTLLPIVALDDIFAIATFGVIIAFAGAYYSGEEIAFIEPFIKIFFSIGLGAVAGFIGYYIFKNMKKKNILLVAAVIVLLITMIIAFLLHAELFMVGIAFGAVLINMFSKEEAIKFNDSTKKLSGAAMIVFMVLIGTTLDITSLLSMVAIVGAIVYIIARSAGKIGGAALGARIAKAPATVRKYLGFTLLPAAGITLTFVGIATQVLPEEYAITLGVVIAAAALINEFIAVFAVKWAFGKSGEIGKAK